MYLRVARRVLLLSLHVLAGLLLTPLSLNRVGGVLRTNPAVTSWWHNRVAKILGITVTVSGYRPQPPALMVSNHVSWLDIVILGGLTPTAFLSKHEVRGWPVIGWLAAMSGTLFIRRGDGQTSLVSEQIAARLDSQDMLTLFPEGTTTDGSEVRPFFSRLFAAALSTKTAIVPVALRYHIDGALDTVAPLHRQPDAGRQSQGAAAKTAHGCPRRFCRSHQHRRPLAQGDCGRGKNRHRGRTWPTGRETLVASR